MFTNSNIQVSHTFAVMVLFMGGMNSLTNHVRLKRKDNYYLLLSDKLNHPRSSAKSYWSKLKTLYNGKKIPLTPPILINSKLISNFN